MAARGRAYHMHGQCDGEVERVEGGLVNDNQMVSGCLRVSSVQDHNWPNSGSLFKGEPIQVDVVFWCGEQIDQLSHLRLERGLQMGQLGCDRRKHLSPAHLEEELDNVNVIRFFPKVRLEQLVDSCLEHESVVDGNVPDSGLRQCQPYRPWTLSFRRTYRFVPARLATSGDAGVHHVVRDEKVRLELGAGVQQCPKVTNPSGEQHRGETGRHRRTEGSPPTKLVISAQTSKTPQAVAHSPARHPNQVPRP